VPAHDGKTPHEPEYDTLEQAILALTQRIREQPNHTKAVSETSTAIKKLQKGVTEFTDLRATLVAQMSMQKRMSLTKIAGLLGVSKSRAGQIVESGKKMLGISPLDPGLDTRDPPQEPDVRRADEAGRHDGDPDTSSTKPHHKC
jgi:hypothetical protein